MSRTVEDLLGNDEMVLEFYMQEPSAPQLLNGWTCSCDFEETDSEPEIKPVTPFELPKIQLYPFTLYNAAQYRPFLRTQLLDPPKYTEHYELNIVKFRDFIHTNVHPHYRVAWMMERRRCQLRKCSLNRRRRMSKN